MPTPDEVMKAKEVIECFTLAKLEAHIEIDDCPLYKTERDALQTALLVLETYPKVVAEKEELKKLNDNLTRNVFVEESPALKVMVETCKQQKDQIADLQAKLSAQERKYDKLFSDYDNTLNRETWLKEERDDLQAKLSEKGRMTKEEIEKVLGNIEIPIDTNPMYVEETNNPAVIKLKSTYAKIIASALSGRIGMGREELRAERDRYREALEKIRELNKQEWSKKDIEDIAKSALAGEGKGEKWGSLSLSVLTVVKK